MSGLTHIERIKKSTAYQAFEVFKISDAARTLSYSRKSIGAERARVVLNDMCRDGDLIAVKGGFRRSGCKINMVQEPWNVTDNGIPIGMHWSMS